MARVVFYSLWALQDGDIKTPKYILTKRAGSYPPIAALAGRDGRPYLYLMSKRGGDPSRPPMFLQGKGGFNLSGLKDLHYQGRLTGVAYGEPLIAFTYGKEKKPNPFFKWRGDGFLFRVLESKFVNMPKTGRVEIPTLFEWLVIDGGRCLAGTLCKCLEMGGFDEEIERLRKIADGFLR